MQEEEYVPALVRIAGIERIDLRMRCIEDRRVARQHGCIGIEEIGQQRELQIAIAIGEESHLQSLGQLLRREYIAEHGRDNHQGAGVIGNAFRIIQPRQCARLNSVRGQPVHQSHRQFAEGNDAQCTDHPDQAVAVQFPVRVCNHRVGEQGDNDSRGSHIGRQWRSLCGHPQGGDQTVGQRNHLFQLRPPIVDQVVANVHGDRILRRRICAGPCQLKRGLGDVAFGQATAARQRFHHTPVAVPGRKIHLSVGVSGILAQDMIHHTQGFHEVKPVLHLQEPQAADAVGDRNAIRGLLLRLGVHHAFDALPGLGQPLLDPGQWQGQRRALPLQTAREFSDEGGRHGRLRARHVGNHQDQILRIRRGHRGKAIGPEIGKVSIGTLDDDACRRPAQVLDQGQAQHDRNRPQLAQIERCDRLIGRDKTGQAVRIDAAVTVRNRLERNIVDPGNLRGSTNQSGQLAAVVFRKMAACDADLLFDEIDIVEQPFIRRGQAVVLLRHLAQQVAGTLDQFLVLAQAFQQQVRSRRRPDAVATRERLAMPLHLFGAEQACAQRRLVGRPVGCAGNAAHKPLPMFEHIDAERTPVHGYLSTPCG